MITCEQITRSTTDFLERRLRLRNRLAFLLHIAMCPGCRTFVKQMRLSILGMQLLKKRVNQSPPAEALLDRFREEIKRDDR